jgi:hypothetical protein
MGVIVLDHFTEGADRDLNGHVPDTGSAWVRIVQTSTNRAVVFAATDQVGANASSVGAAGELLKSQPSPVQTGQDVQIKIITVYSGASWTTVLWGLHARMVDQNNYYALRAHSTGISPRLELIKVVGGVRTQLASSNTVLVANDVVRLSVRNGSQKVYVNDVEVLSATDTQLTLPGECGFSVGQVTANDPGEAQSTWRFDDYQVTETAESGAGSGGRMNQVIMLGG